MLIYREVRRIYYDVQRLGLGLGNGLGRWFIDVLSWDSVYCFGYNDYCEVNQTWRISFNDNVFNKANAA
jgi:hypothetical protein